MQLDRHKVFRAFKYTVYVLLAINVYVFFAEEWAASAHRFADGIALVDIIEGFAASIDTAAWVVLLLMFELEISGRVPQPHQIPQIIILAFDRIAPDKPVHLTLAVSSVYR